MGNAQQNELNRLLAVKASVEAELEELTSKPTWDSLREDAMLFAIETLEEEIAAQRKLMRITKTQEFFQRQENLSHLNPW